MLDILIAAGLVAGVAAAGWAGGHSLGQRLPVKAIIVGAAATLALLGAAFFVLDSGSRPHDANIGAGLVFVVLVAVLVATPSAIVTARRRTHG